MTTSASIMSPLVNVTPVTFVSPLIEATCTAQRISTPLRACTAPIAAPISGPSARMSGASRPSSTVTFAPRLVAVAAASKPMNPAPITTTRAPSTSSSRNAAASSSVRNTCTPAMSGWFGKRRTRPPVAMMRPSYEMLVPSASVTIDASVFNDVAG